MWATYSCLVSGTGKNLTKIKALQPRDRPCRMRGKKKVKLTPAKATTP